MTKLFDTLILHFTTLLLTFLQKIILPEILRLQFPIQL